MVGQFARGDLGRTRARVEAGQQLLEVQLIQCHAGHGKDNHTIIAGLDVCRSVCAVGDRNDERSEAKLCRALLSVQSNVDVGLTIAGIDAQTGEENLSSIGVR